MSQVKRRRKLRKLLRGADAILVTNESNVRYLTGFTGDSSYLIVTSGGDEAAVLISDPRYEEQIEEQCPGLATHIRKPSELLLPVTCKLLKRMDVSKLVVEANSMTLSMFDQLQEAKFGELIRGKAEVESLRAIKDAGEVKLIRRAVDIAERAFISMRAQMRPNMTELEFAHELEHSMRKLGAEGCAFDPIVAVGPRAALPHAEPGTNQLSENPFVLIDWGATVDGYRSDLTRVLTTGRIPAKIFKAYEAVLTAQLAAIDALRPGVTGCEVDAIVRETLAGYSMEKRFNHGLGHGIGLDIHEAPRMGKNFPTPVEAGMVVTVEPGVYYPGLGGIRIEDDVLITESGAEVLSSLPKDFDANIQPLLS